MDTARTSSTEWDGIEQLGLQLYQAAKIRFKHLESQAHSDIEGFDNALFGAVSHLRKGKSPNLDRLGRSLAFHRPRARARLACEFSEIVQLASFQLLLATFVEVAAGILPTTSTKS